MPNADDLAVEVNPATESESIVTLVCAVWLTAGLFLDGYAHDSLLTGSESFFTPWHAVLYLGLAATTWAIGRMLVSRYRVGMRFHDALPVGYRLSALGIAIFALGGVGDALWHTRYGIEQGTEALYSPTHLMLLAGLVLIVTGPARAVFHRVLPIDLGWRDLAPLHVSVTLSVAIVAFFSPWGFYQTGWYLVAYNPETGMGEDALTAALASELITTIIMIVASLVILRRHRPPIGAMALLFGAATTAFALAFGGSGAGLAAAVAGGLCMDFVLHGHTGPISTASMHQTRVAIACFFSPVVMWGTYHLLLASDGRFAWAAPFAAGTPLLCGLTGLGLFLFGSPIGQSPMRQCVRETIPDNAAALDDTRSRHEFTTN